MTVTMTVLEIDQLLPLLEDLCNRLVTSHFLRNCTVTIIAITYPPAARPHFKAVSPPRVRNSGVENHYPTPLANLSPPLTPSLMQPASKRHIVPMYITPLPDLQETLLS